MVSRSLRFSSWRFLNGISGCCGRFPNLEYLAGNDHLKQTDTSQHQGCQLPKPSFRIQLSNSRKGGCHSKIPRDPSQTARQWRILTSTIESSQKPISRIPPIQRSRGNSGSPWRRFRKIQGIPVMPIPATYFPGRKSTLALSSGVRKRSGLRTCTSPEGSPLPAGLRRHFRHDSLVLVIRERLGAHNALLSEETLGRSDSLRSISICKILRIRTPQ